MSLAIFSSIKVRSTIIAGVSSASNGSPTCGWYMLITPYKRALFLREEYAFHLGVELCCVHTHLTTDSALFVAAKRSFGMYTMAGVDREHASAHALRYAQSTAQVLRPHRAGQAIGRVVRQSQRFLFALEGNDADNRPKNLLTCHVHLVINIDQHGRLHKIAIFFERR